MSPESEHSKYKEPEDLWECFCDLAYYNLWAVRRKDTRKWGECFHMHSAEEAKALTELLNRNRVI
jgi:hypothetical protein